MRGYGFQELLESFDNEAYFVELGLGVEDSETIDREIESALAIMECTCDHIEDEEDCYVPKFEYDVEGEFNKMKNSIEDSRNKLKTLISSCKEKCENEEN